LRIVEPLDQLSKPLIAAINSLAYGGGLELALACDIRIAVTPALCAAGGRIGSMPGGGGTQRPAVIGPTLAAQMILTGEPIDAPLAVIAAKQALCAAAECTTPRTSTSSAGCSTRWRRPRIATRVAWHSRKRQPVFKGK
jgi:hypothetical protein